MTGSTITYDAVEDIRAEICSSWNTDSNDAGAKPRIREFWNVKVVGFGGGKAEEIIIKPGEELIAPFALFGQAYWHKLPMEIDIRIYSTVKRLNVVVKEVERIVKNMIRRDQQGFLQVVITASKTKVPDYRNMYRHTIHLTYEAASDHTFV